MSSKKLRHERLPDGWVLCSSKSNPGRKYYFNKKTGKSSWTQPEATSISERKNSKKEKNKVLEKKKKEEIRKGGKRKSDGDVEHFSKRKKHETRPPPEGQAQTQKTSEVSHTITSQAQSSIKSHETKTISHTSPLKSAESSKKLKKNLANSRLTQLRARLSNEAELEDRSSSSPAKRKRASPNESPSKFKDDKSPSSDSKSNQSPNDSLHSIPSPSQFFAANKILSSMKAQLPEEFCPKEKQRDTFADIVKGINSQTPEYPFSKHPATPPQFSEASKLVSAIKSKLSYKVSTPKDVKTFSSAKDRMEILRANLSLDLDSDCTSTNESFFNGNQLNSTCSSSVHSEAMEVEDFREDKQSTPNKNSISNDDNVVLVMDTNIFIHDLDIIKDILSSHLEGYREQPSLVVPWRVINELDRLKDNNNGNGTVCVQARAAMDYLYKSLPENGRIKGQSLRDANSHIYPCEMADDEILNCALQQVERGHNVVVVTNDKNLRNKAQINGVRHAGARELRAQLARTRANAHARAHSHTHATPARYADALLPLLSTIFENEMRAAYGEVWRAMAAEEDGVAAGEGAGGAGREAGAAGAGGAGREAGAAGAGGTGGSVAARPRALRDVVRALLRHWAAVFANVFPRIRPLLVDLRRCLTSLHSKDPKTVTPSELSTLKELCLDVARRCQIIPEYMNLAKTCVENLQRDGVTETDVKSPSTAASARAINNMTHSGPNKTINGVKSTQGATETEDRVGWNASSANETANMSGTGSVNGMVDRVSWSASERGSVQGLSETEERVGWSATGASGTDLGTGAVVDAFECLWTVCSSYCAKLATSVGVAHTIEDKIPGDESLHNLADKWTVFASTIESITQSIQRILVSDSGAIEDALRNLEASFKTALTSLCIDKQVSAQELRIFSVQCRNMLQEASSKFSQLRDMLVTCKDCLTR